MNRNDCEVFYDAAHRRLVYAGMPADESYWDDHWETTVDSSLVRTPDRFVLGVTREYLPQGSTVIDAGCGLARTVFGLHEAGYRAYGIDYAPRTVQLVNRLAPELQVTVSDVRKMEAFSDSFFDGYWSLGVVEHFYAGYGDIVREMRRVLKDGGLAFVTVPTMSPLRRAKAVAGVYPSWTGSEVSRFYQFALPADLVISEFTNAGFELVRTAPRGGFKGLKDEAGILRNPLQRFYNSHSRPLRTIRAGLDRLLAPATCHTRLYVFRAHKT